MIINAGFNRPIRKNNHVYFECVNVQNISINNLNFYNRKHNQAIIQEIMKHKPLGNNWTITGYALVKE